MKCMQIDGGSQTRASVSVRGVDTARIESLSRREREVLGLAATGRIDKEICAELGISPNTLRTYWSRIRAKVGEVPRSALAVAYAQELTGSAPNAVEPHDWEIDLARRTFTSLTPGPPANGPLGEPLPLDESLLALHPDDLPGFRRFLETLGASDLRHFSYTVRVVTPLGIERSTSFVRVIRDATGRAIRLLGTRSSNVDLRAPHRERVLVGYWERDLRTNVFTADAAYCAALGIDPADPDLRLAAIHRFHPDDRLRAANIVDLAAADGKAAFSFTHRLIGPNGAYRWAATDVRIEYAAGKPILARGTALVFDAD